MNILRTEGFKVDFKQLPKLTQEKFAAKIRLFINDIHHPSLRVKKMKGHKNRWEASIALHKLLLQIPPQFYHSA